MMGLGLLVTAWFSYVASVHGLSTDDVLGLLPCVVIAPMVVARRSELVVVVAFTACAASPSDGPRPRRPFPRPR